MALIKNTVQFFFIREKELFSEIARSPYHFTCVEFLCVNLILITCQIPKTLSFTSVSDNKSYFLNILMQKTVFQTDNLNRHAFSKHYQPVFCAS